MAKDEEEKDEIKGFWTDNKYELAGPPILLALFFFFSFTTPYLYMEYLSVNVRYIARAHNDTEVHKDLLILGIDDSSLKTLGRWPWPRGDVHGHFMNLLVNRPPKVISYDIFFPDPSKDFYQDFNFGQYQAYHPAAVTGALSERPIGEEKKEDFNPPWLVDWQQSAIDISRIKGDNSMIHGHPNSPNTLKALDDAGFFGFVEIENLQDEMLIKRYMPLVYYEGGEFYPTKTLVAVLRYWGITTNKIRSVALGESIVLDTFAGEMSIPINERAELADDAWMLETVDGDASGLPTYKGKAVRLSDAEGVNIWKLVPADDFSDDYRYPSVLRIGNNLFASAALAAILASSEATIDDMFVIVGDFLEISIPSLDFYRTMPINDRGEFVDKTQPITKIVGNIEDIYGYPTALYPVRMVQESGYFAFVDTEASKIDGIRRRYPLLLHTGGHVYPSLSLRSVMMYYDVKEDDVEVELGKSLTLNLPDGSKKVVPINEKGEFNINYRNEKVFSAAGYADIFKKLVVNNMLEEKIMAAEAAGKDTSEMPKPEWPADWPPIQDQLIVIGQTAAGLTDLGPTPFEGRSPLVRVQANVMDNIMKGDYLHIMPNWPFVLSTLLLAWVTLFALKDRSLMVSVGVPALIIVIYVAAAFILFGKWSVQIPFIWPMLSFASAHMGAYYLHWKKESEQKDRIKNMFGTYLSPELVGQMVDSGDEPQLGGVESEITAFFSDVQSFSTFSEKLTPTQLVDLMNEYLTAMTRILMDEKCYVDKYIGDAIVGIFNAPVELKDHAYRGCIACLLQHKALADLRDKWKSEGDKWPDIVPKMQARMGMNTGTATVGNMGSEDRFNYTMMGDTVNLAARCESGAKAYGVYTMVTGECKEHAEASGDRIIFRYLDKIIVKGRSVPATMYELVCLREDLNPEIEKCLEVYNDAMNLYLEQKFQEAYDKFMEAAALEPNRKELNSMAPTTPSNVMAERCLEMKDDPPGEGWDGVFVMKTK